MREAIDHWLSSASAAISEASGAEGLRAIDREWAALDGVSRPVVTVFGSYDSGKSSLLKRLLVDAAVSVPAWLSISARRETFEVGVVDALGCRFRDTPGIAGGNLEHEQMARDAITLSDVILLVVPPQLITGDRDVMTSVLSGEAFRRGGLEMGGAVITVIAKLDEGSVDPSDDREGYDDYLSLKRKEWAQLLHSAKIDSTDGEVYTVAADPFQRVGNRSSASPSDYRDAYREWDGIAALEKALRALPSRLADLRSASRRRFLCSRMEALCQAAEARAAEVSLARDVARDNRERFALLDQQLDALLKAARTSLDGVVEEELLTAARSRVESPTAVEEFLAPRMNKAVGRWWDEQMAVLQKLVMEAEAQVEARGRSPGEVRARKAFNPAEKRDAEKDRPPLYERRLTSIAKKARAALLEHHERTIGMKLGKAREELKRLDEAKSFTDYSKASGRRQSFTSLRDAEKARKIVGFHVAAEAVPVLLEIGVLIWEEAQRRQLEKERAARRAELRELLRGEASRMAGEAWDEWRLTSDEFKRWLRLHTATAEAAEAAGEEALRLSSAAVSVLRKALA